MKAWFRKWLPDATTPIGAIFYSLIATTIIAGVSFVFRHVEITLYWH